MPIYEVCVFGEEFEATDVHAILIINNKCDEAVSSAIPQEANPDLEEGDVKTTVINKVHEANNFPAEYPMKLGAQVDAKVSLAKERIDNISRLASAPA